MHLPDPTFPPLLNGHGVKSPLRPFNHAITGARTREFGAGDVVWSRNTALFDCAIVLEPEVAYERALEMLYLSMVALGDAIGALSPPEIAVTYWWPQTIRVNGAYAGEVRIAAGPQDGAGVPEWLVLGAEIAMRGDLSDPDPGRHPDRTSLQEEGAGEFNRTDLIESYCRHFLTWLHSWEQDGFRPVHEAWLFRADGYEKDTEIDYRGERLAGHFVSLDDTGNLLLKTQEGMQLLRTALAARELEAEAPGEAQP